jgi:hypothetical protein
MSILINNRARAANVYNSSEKLLIERSNGTFSLGKIAALL